MLKLFSTDDHIVEPPNVWVDRVPAKLKARVPHVIEEDGAQMWVWEGGSERTMGLNAVAGKPREEWGMEPKRFTDMIPGCYDPDARYKDFILDGVFASVGFPTLGGFGGRKFSTFADKELALACVQAYNDFVIDEWCGSHPDMFVPMTIAPTWDVDLAVAEFQRCLDRGAKALCWVENPGMIGEPDYHGGYWDNLFALAQEADVPVCMHIGSGGTAVNLAGVTNPIVGISSAFVQAAASAVNMMCSPIPRKFPDVKLVWSEGGMGWITAALERADRQWDRHKYWNNLADESVLPSTVARRNMWFCMIEEPIGFKYRHDFEIEKILWESDYPHADTPFPHTQKTAQEVFVGVPQDEVDLVTHLNAEKLFKHKINDDLIALHLKAIS